MKVGDVVRITEARPDRADLDCWENEAKKWRDKVLECKKRGLYIVQCVYSYGIALSGGTGVLFKEEELELAEGDDDE